MISILSTSSRMDISFIWFCRPWFCSNSQNRKHLPHIQVFLRKYEVFFINLYKPSPMSSNLLKFRKHKPAYLSNPLHPSPSTPSTGKCKCQEQETYHFSNKVQAIQNSSCYVINMLPLEMNCATSEVFGFVTSFKTTNPVQSC